MRRPDLWGEALQSARDHLPTRWWLRLLPVPDREWMAFRMETAFAHRMARPDPAALVSFLAWSRGERRAATEAHRATERALGSVGMETGASGADGA